MTPSFLTQLDAVRRLAEHRYHTRRRRPTPVHASARDSGRAPPVSSGQCHRDAALTQAARSGRRPCQEWRVCQPLQPEGGRS
jgi:hypothetical protein